jgi:hypothetical protein
MPMGIVSDSEFESEHSKLNKTPPKSDVKEGVVVDIKRGRGDTPEVPNGLRNLIGITSVNEGRKDALELAKQFGISASSTSAYSKGATSTATYDKTPNGGVINGVKEKIQTKARRKMMLALNHITADKLKDTKPRDLAGIARDMSAIVKDMEPDTVQSADSNQKAPFVVFAPIIKDERNFEVLVVKE